MRKHIDHLPDVPLDTEISRAIKGRMLAHFDSQHRRMLSWVAPWRYASRRAAWRTASLGVVCLLLFTFWLWIEPRPGDLSRPLPLTDWVASTSIHSVDSVGPSSGSLTAEASDQNNLYVAQDFYSTKGMTALTVAPLYAIDRLTGRLRILAGGRQRAVSETAVTPGYVIYEVVVPNGGVDGIYKLSRKSHRVTTVWAPGRTPQGAPMPSYWWFGVLRSVIYVPMLTSQNGQSTEQVLQARSLDGKLLGQIALPRSTTNSLAVTDQGVVVSTLQGMEIRPWREGKWTPLVHAPNLSIEATDGRTIAYRSGASLWIFAPGREGTRMLSADLAAGAGEVSVTPQAVAWEGSRDQGWIYDRVNGHYYTFTADSVQLSAGTLTWTKGNTVHWCRIPS